MNVDVRNEEHLGIVESMACYHRQGNCGGDYFLQRIFEDIDSLGATVGIHKRHFGYHRKIASRHPFLIYYRMVTTGVEVVAVLDGRSRPEDIDMLLQRRYLGRTKHWTKVLDQAALTCVESTPRTRSMLTFSRTTRFPLC